MISIEDFVNIINCDFFTGVPDSLLKSLGNYLINKYGISNKHIIAVNEGNAVALAAGYHLSTGRIPCVYLQNSGLGNIVNPVASLLNDEVYGIPCIFIIGWRGEPDVHDEPQHIFQGKITLKIIEDLDMPYLIIDKSSSITDVQKKMVDFDVLLQSGKSVAFVVKKGALTYDKNIKFQNENNLLREEIVRCITNISNDDLIISTTGKTSRELFEIREKNGQSHKFDFLTVGSMGHSSSIALGVALNKPNKKVWCIDGDGATLMHMGAMAVIGNQSPKNLIHVVINNGAHESVGGNPTVANNIDLTKIAFGCSYKEVFLVKDINELKTILSKIKNLDGPIFIEIKAAIGSREDLGRPTTTPKDNKLLFMNYLGDYSL